MIQFSPDVAVLCAGLGLGRMAEGNVRVVTRAFKRVVAGYKSPPSIVVRAIVATLLGTGDLVSDVYTTVNLFSLSHLERPGIRDGRDNLREHGSAGRGQLCIGTSACAAARG